MDKPSEKASYQDLLIDAVEERIKDYEGDDRPDILTDVMNAFFAGSAFRETYVARQLEDGGSAGLPIDMSEAKRLVTQLRGALADMRIERDTLSQGLRLANEHRAGQDAKVAELQAELEEDYELRERLGGILTSTANALKGQPDPLMLHSWHDLAEWASSARAAADAAASLDAGRHQSIEEYEELVAMVRAWPRRLVKDATETAQALAMVKEDGEPLPPEGAPG